MYKNFTKFLDKCKNICLEKVKKTSSGEVVNSLFGVLIKDEDSDLIKFNLTKSEKNTLIKEYEKILPKDKSLFWKNLDKTVAQA